MWISWRVRPFRKSGAETSGRPSYTVCNRIKPWSRTHFQANSSILVLLGVPFVSFSQVTSRDTMLRLYDYS